MNRLFAILCASMLTLSMLTGCGQNAATGNGPSDSTPEQSSTENIVEPSTSED